MFTSARPTPISPEPMLGDPMLPLRAVSTVFLLAHPDDEMLIAGTIRRLVVQGADVHCLWATAGEHDGPRKWLRWREAKEAMETLGVRADRLTFLDLPFLGMLDVLDDAAERLAARLQTIAPRQIFTVAFEGGHIDHDAVNFLAYEALWRSGVAANLYEFPLYNGSGPWCWFRFRVNAFPASDGPSACMPLPPDILACKKRVMQRYRSQWGFVAAFRCIAFARRLHRRGEPYRACPADREHTRPPHRGKLNIERWFNRYMGLRFDDFRRAVRAVRRRPSAGSDVGSAPR